MYAMVIIVFLLGIILLFWWRISKFKGEKGFESYLEELKSKGYLFENVLLENQTMVRYLFISSQGIFNIFYNREALGRIYGDDEDFTWQVVMEHRKLPLPNPVRLMEEQRQAFEEIGASLGVDLPIHEVVCLSRRVQSKLVISVPIVSLEALVAWVDDKESLLTDEMLKCVVKYFERLQASEI